jgi:hypothetical protein
MTTFVRPARAEDRDKFIEWAKGKNLDPNVLKPEFNSYILCAFNKKGIIAFLPIQSPQFVSVQMLEALISNPDASDLEIASALRELIKHAITIGYLKECGEIYFIGDHPETNKIAERIFEKIEYPVYRLSLKNLEG